MSEEQPDNRFVLILPPALTHKMGLLRDVYYPSKPISYACHSILDERYSQFIAEMKEDVRGNQ